ncbi:hypothetical protein N7475_004528 [Penicillium sp. IBT 31633x]|nr:hypothetical protein N7475_004528 [Penicillium sp. IBT 31633x]
MIHLSDQGLSVAVFAILNASPLALTAMTANEVNLGLWNHVLPLICGGQHTALARLTAGA